jgi:hypothetical protein
MAIKERADKPNQGKFLARMGVQSYQVAFV